MIIRIGLTAAGPVRNVMSIIKNKSKDNKEADDEDFI